jgi:hypothetical protein
MREVEVDFRGREGATERGPATTIFCEAPLVRFDRMVLRQHFSKQRVRCHEGDAIALPRKPSGTLALISGKSARRSVVVT